jgi:hypothetical protein
MAVTIQPFNPLDSLSIPVRGTALAMCSTTLFVLNKNTKVQTSKYDDPWDAIGPSVDGFSRSTDAATSGTGSTNCILVPVPIGLRYLDSYHIYGGVASTAANGTSGSDPSTQLIARFYGWIPRRPGSIGTTDDSTPPGGRSWPEDVLTSAVWSASNGIWTPLDDPNSSGFPTSISYTNTAAARRTTSTTVYANYSISPRRSVLLNGCTHVLATIEQAMVSTATGGFLAGFFRN